MSDILIVGKELPDCLELAESFITTRKVFAVTKNEADNQNFEGEGIYGSTWNKSSAISSRALLIKAETKLQELDEFLIVFDSYDFATKFELDRTENISLAIDTMISSYQYFINELLQRLEQRKDNVRIVFLVKTYPSRYENFHAGNKNVNIHPTSNIVNAAQQAFISLAENFSTFVSDKQYLSVLLARCDYNNENFNSEKQTGTWIKDSLEAIKGFKNHQTAKSAANWVKVGNKVSNGFALFK